MLLAVRMSRAGRTWKVRRALKKLELFGCAWSNCYTPIYNSIYACLLGTDQFLITVKKVS